MYLAVLVSRMFRPGTRGPYDATRTSLGSAMSFMLSARASDTRKQRQKVVRRIQAASGLPYLRGRKESASAISLVDGADNLGGRRTRQPVGQRLDMPRWFHRRKGIMM